MTIGMVVNPVTAADLADGVREELDGVEVVVVETTVDDPGAGQAAELLRRRVDLVVACGGDGTVRACGHSLAGTDTPLAVAPAGTGNLLALNFDLPDEPGDIAALIRDGEDRRIDTGICNGETFLIMTGAGFDARIMEETSREAKNRFGPLAYVATALQHVGDDPISVEIESGRSVDQLEIATVLIGNVGRLQGGADVFPDAAPTDGLLDLLAIKASTTPDWLAAAVDTLTKKDRSEQLLRRRINTAAVRFGRDTPYQIDGEERPATRRLDVAVQPSSLTIRIPRREET